MTIDNVDELYGAIKKMRDLQKEVHDYISKYIKYKSVPIEDRWELFSNNRDLFPKHSWVMYFKELESNDIKYYEDLGYERHMDIDLVDMVDFILEVLDEGSLDVRGLKEEVLENGYSSFRFDW